jgi:hypothetical protein
VRDRFRDFTVIGVGVMDDFAGQLELIEHDYALGRPPDGFNRAQRFLLRCWRFRRAPSKDPF